MGEWTHGHTGRRGEAQGRWLWPRWLEDTGISPSSHVTGNLCLAAISQKEALCASGRKSLSCGWEETPSLGPGLGPRLSVEGISLRKAVLTLCVHT